MMAFRHFLATLAIVFLSIFSQAQPGTPSVPVKETENKIKPYRILTLGKQVTIKSTKDIKSVIVWTSDGHRIVEDKTVNNASYTFRVTVKEKIFFVRVQLIDGKTYSEKIGVE